MGNPELCILLDSILALLETDNTEKAKEVIKNGMGVDIFRWYFDGIVWSLSHHVLYKRNYGRIP